MSTTLSSASWKNRIVGEGQQAAKDFVLNPRNFRTHSDAQTEALEAILGEVGWVQRVVVNRRTGKVIDGELRILSALKQGEETKIPFVEVDLSEEEELKVLAVLDRISAMAGTNPEKLQEIYTLIDFDSPLLDSLVSHEIGLLTTEINLDDFFVSKPDLGRINPAETVGFSILLHFETEDEYRQTLAALNSINVNPAAAVRQLLEKS